MGLKSYIRGLLGYNDDNSRASCLKRDRDYSDDDPPVMKKYKTVKSHFPKVVMASEEDDWVNPRKVSTGSRVCYVPISKEGFPSTSTPTVRVPSFSSLPQTSQKPSSSSYVSPSSAEWKRPSQVYSSRSSFRSDLSGIARQGPSPGSQVRRPLNESERPYFNRMTNTSGSKKIETIYLNDDEDGGDEDDEDNILIEENHPNYPKYYSTVQKKIGNDRTEVVDLSDGEDYDIVYVKRRAEPTVDEVDDAQRERIASKLNGQSFFLEPKWKYFKSKMTDSRRSVPNSMSRSSFESNGQFKTPQTMGRAGLASSPFWRTQKNYMKKKFSYGITPSFRISATKAATAKRSFRMADKKKYEELIRLSKDNFVSANLPAKHSPLDLTDIHSFINKFSSDRGGSFSEQTKDSHSAFSKQEEVVDLEKDESHPVSAAAINLSDSDTENVASADDTSTSSVRIAPVNSLKMAYKDKPLVNDDWYAELNRKYQNIQLEKKSEVEDCVYQNNLIRQVNFEQRKTLIDHNVKHDMTLPIEFIDLEEDEVTLPELSDEQEEIIDDALQRNPPNQVLITKFSISIHRRDIASLSGLNWLNDEVINFYMNLIMERSQKKGMPRVYGMSTFFYPKLMQSGHAALKRWTRKVDIFSHDYILIPIHLGVHWCMSIIDFRKKTVKYYDSMGGKNMDCCKALIKYLQDESIDKKSKEFDTKGWQGTCEKDIPQQMNGSDCGMFSCTFAEFITRDAAISFSQKDMPYLRRKMILEIVTGQLLM